MGRRHLTPEEAADALRRGRQVEQLLASEPHGGRATVRWLTISPRRGGAYDVIVHHVYDDGDEDFVDVAEFSPVDDDEGIGEGADLAQENDPEAALEAATAHGASPDRWVNAFVVGDEYADARDAP